MTRVVTTNVKHTRPSEWRWSTERADVLSEAKMLLFELNEASRRAVKSRTHDAAEGFYIVSDKVERFLRDAIGNE